MTIGNVSNYANYSMTGYYGSSSQVSSTENKTQASGKPQGPPPGGGKGGGGGPQGPNLDTDGDDLWSSSEVSEYAAYSSSVLGVELDSDELISTYDVDGNGYIDSEERAAMKDANALQLPEPSELQSRMNSGNMIQFNLQNQVDSTETSEATESTNDVNAYMLEQLMNAYNQGSTSSIEDYLASLTYQV